MVSEAFVIGDEFKDSEGYEYEVVAATPYEIVGQLIILDRPFKAGENIFVIFERSRTTGVWQDRDMPEPKVFIVEAL